MNFKKLIEIFWSKVKRTKTCWLWVGGKCNSYGDMSVKNRSFRMYAHRFSWLLHNGKIPKGMFVCHRCDIPLCVNPKHLFLGTVLDNNRDMYKKGRMARGEACKRSSLTDTDIRYIRKVCRYISGWKPLALRFNVTRKTIQNIVNRKAWTHIK